MNNIDIKKFKAVPRIGTSSQPMITFSNNYMTMNMALRRLFPQAGFVAFSYYGTQILMSFKPQDWKNLSTELSLTLGNSGFCTAKSLIRFLKQKLSLADPEQFKSKYVVEIIDSEHAIVDIAEPVYQEAIVRRHRNRKTQEV